ncbi:MAG: LysM peptidoglycan-binding domain-containing protein [Planctomycetota bacterium]|nr:MAG: LysM peptidoglycan-binding domain-containing protein [Planctomycetota bacterium]
MQKAKKFFWIGGSLFLVLFVYWLFPKSPEKTENITKEEEVWTNQSQKKSSSPAKVLKKQKAEPAKAPKSKKLAKAKLAKLLQQIKEHVANFDYLTAHRLLVQYMQKYPRWRSNFEPLFQECVNKILFSPIPWDRSHMYHIQKGDTLGKLERRFQISLAMLQHWNPEVARGALKVSQRLKIIPGPVQAMVQGKSFHLYLGNLWLGTYAYTSKSTLPAGRYHLKFLRAVGSGQTTRTFFAILERGAQRGNLAVDFPRFPPKACPKIFARGAALTISPNIFWKEDKKADKPSET